MHHICSSSKFLDAHRTQQSLRSTLCCRLHFMRCQLCPRAPLHRRSIGMRTHDDRPPALQCPCPCPFRRVLSGGQHKSTLQFNAREPNQPGFSVYGRRLVASERSNSSRNPIDHCAAVAGAAAVARVAAAGRVYCDRESVFMARSPTDAACIHCTFAATQERPMYS